MFTDAHLYLGVAGAGVVSFLSPCVLPLVPPYLIFLGASALHQQPLLPAALLFSLGFAAVFVALGASASPLGQWIADHKQAQAIASSLAITGYGLQVMGVLKVAQSNSTVWRLIGAFTIGVAFAFGWTPCVGPILQTILAHAARTETLAFGVTLLFVYAMGLGLPFILLALAVRPVLSVQQTSNPPSRALEKTLGVLLAVTGALFLTGFMNEFGNWMIETFPGLATIEETLTPQALKNEIIQHGTPG